MGNGQVFIRSVAEDEDRRRVYRAGGVETQAVLLEMVERGRRGIARARERLREWDGPFAIRQMGYVSAGGQAWRTPPGGILVRAAPVTGSRLEEWSISEPATRALASTVQAMLRIVTGAEAELLLHVSGLAARVAGEVALMGADGVSPRRPVATAVADAAGIVGVAMSWGNSMPPGDPVRMTLNGFRDQMLLPVLDGLCELLTAAELHGRSFVQLSIGNLQQIAEIDDAGGIKQVPQLSLGEVISLPLEPDRATVRLLAQQWCDDVGRAAGYRRFRGRA
jgi:hypothetical protein